MLVTFEVSSIAITTILLSQKVGRLPLRRLAAFGLYLAAVAEIVSAYLGMFELLIVMRILVGVGCGCIYSAAVAAVAITRDPDRTYACGALIANILFTALLFILPMTTAFGHQKGVFITLGIVLVSTLWFLLRLPKRSREDKFSEGMGKQGIMVSNRIKVMMFASFFLVNLAMGTTWSYVERISLDIDIDAKTLGWMFSASTIAMMVGSVIAGILGTRIGRTIPLAVGILGSAVSCLLLVIPDTPAIFLCSLIMWGLFYLISYPYFIGTPAAIDPNGRLSSAVAGTCLLAYSLGPLLGGYVSETLQYTAVGWVGVIFCVISLLLALPVCRTLDRHVKFSRVGQKAPGLQNLEIFEKSR